MGSSQTHHHNPYPMVIIGLNNRVIYLRLHENQKKKKKRRINYRTKNQATVKCNVNNCGEKWKERVADRRWHEQTIYHLQSFELLGLFNPPPIHGPNIHLTFIYSLLLNSYTLWSTHPPHSSSVLSDSWYNIK